MTQLPITAPAVCRADRNKIHFRTPIVRNRYDAFVKEWINCRACPLSKTRKHVVHFRGTLPCRVLFVGEAPGESEDALGYPFVGPAGTLLDDLVEPCFAKYPLRWGVANVVACLPLHKDEDKWGTGDLRPPVREEAEACSGRFRNLLAIANPDLIVTLGDVAKRFLPPREIRSSRATGKTRPAVCHLIHPSAILKMASPIKQAMAEKRFTLTLCDVLRELT